MAVGQRISLAIGHNPTKVIGSDKFLLALHVMIDGFAKEDPPTRKMLPIEADVPELLVQMGYSKSRTAHTRAVGDLSLIAFYYLLRIGEYTVKGKRNNTKQTVQFKLEDVTFYKKRRVDSYAVSLKTHLLISCCPPIVQPSNCTTKRMGGKECVCIRK